MSDDRPVNLAPDAVWPSHAQQRRREVIVIPGVRILHELGPRTALRPDVQQRPLQDVRSGLVDPDVGLVPPPPPAKRSVDAPSPDTEDVRPATQTQTRSASKQRAARAVDDLKRKAKRR